MVGRFVEVEELIQESIMIMIILSIESPNTFLPFSLL